MCSFHVCFLSQCPAIPTLLPVRKCCKMVVMGGRRWGNGGQFGGGWGGWGGGCGIPQLEVYSVRLRLICILILGCYDTRCCIHPGVVHIPNPLSTEDARPRHGWFVVVLFVYSVVSFDLNQLLCLIQLKAKLLCIYFRLDIVLLDQVIIYCLRVCCQRSLVLLSVKCDAIVSAVCCYCQ